MPSRQQLSGACSTILVREWRRTAFRLPALTRIGHGAFWSRFILTPPRDPHRFSQLSTRSIRFFCLGVRIGDPDRAAFAFAYRLTRLAPTPVVLPGIPRFMQHLEKGSGADLGQTVFSLSECPLQSRQRPGGAARLLQVRLALKLLKNPGVLRLSVLRLKSAPVTRDQGLDALLVEAAQQSRYRSVASASDARGSKR